MGCFIVAVSITYRRVGNTGAGTTITRTSACHASPFSIGLDRSRDGFFLYYNGGDQKLEGGWNQYDLLASSIISQTPCTGCVIPRFDCLNGVCISSAQYKTPGVFETLDQCQTACGGSGCNGVCISHSDWAQISGLASKLKNKNCS